MQDAIDSLESQAAILVNMLNTGQATWSEYPDCTCSPPPIGDEIIQMLHEERPRCKRCLCYVFQEVEDEKQKERAVVSKEKEANPGSCEKKLCAMQPRNRGQYKKKRMKLMKTSWKVKLVNAMKRRQARRLDATSV